MAIKITNIKLKGLDKYKSEFNAMNVIRNKLSEYGFKFDIKME